MANTLAGEADLRVGHLFETWPGHFPRTVTVVTVTSKGTWGVPWLENLWSRLIREQGCHRHGAQGARVKERDWGYSILPFWPMAWHELEFSGTGTQNPTCSRHPSDLPRCGTAYQLSLDGSNTTMPLTLSVSAQIALNGSFEQIWQWQWSCGHWLWSGNWV